MDYFGVIPINVNPSSAANIAVKYEISTWIPENFQTK